MNTGRRIGNPQSTTGHFERGFTLIELAIATLVLLVGVVSVMQLVPSAIKLNLRNRQDTTSAVIAQRMRDLMEQQAITDTFIDDPTGRFPCCDPAKRVPPQTCGLIPPGTCSFANGGCQTTANGLIDFGQNPPPANYSFFFTNPDDPGRVAYEVRWRIADSVGSVGGPNVTLLRRLIVGARRGGDPSYSVSFVSVVAR